MFHSEYGWGGASRGIYGGGGNRQFELRLWPDYDAHGEFEDNEDGVPTLYLCRYLVPWCIARVLSRVGINCGLRLSTGGLPGWALGTASGRRWLFFTILVILLVLLSWTAFSRGRHTRAILASPCYVCNPKMIPDPDPERNWFLKDPMANETVARLELYSRYAYGSLCALDDTWIRALERERTMEISAARQRELAAEKNGTGQLQSCSGLGWHRFDRWLPNRALPVKPDATQPEQTTGQKQQPQPWADWRHTLPRVYVVGCRGAGTTSLRHYLDAHPDTAIRYQPELSSAYGQTGQHQQQPKTGRHRTKPVVGNKGAPWDDHFFASVPDWTPDELRSWVRRGWGAPSIRDHRGQGRLRIEFGPDYLWLANTGAATSIRRARLPDPDPWPKFLVLLRDPVALVREAYERAVDAGIEPEDSSFARVVARELPRLARCLWWDRATLSEQQERVVSGLCGAIGAPGRIGGPYVWRGLLPLYLAYWIRTATPGKLRQQWYFLRSQDLLQQPNQTLNRLAVQVLGLAPFDYGPFVRRVWHPSPSVVKQLAPGAPWRQSWKSYVPRLEMVQWARKRTTDALLDAASAAAKRFIPGLEAALKTREKLKQLHCRLAGLLEEGQPTTHAGRDCMRPSETSSSSKANGKEQQQFTEEERAAERDRLAEDALRDFFAPYQAHLMDMVESIEASRLDSAILQQRYKHHDRPQNTNDAADDTNQSSDDQLLQQLQSFYLQG